MINLKPYYISTPVALLFIFNFLGLYISLAQENNNYFAIIDVTVIDGTGAMPLEKATVIIKNGKIACVGKCTVEKDVPIIDGSGKYLIPGLVDAHVHYGMSGWYDTFPVPGFVPDVSDKFPYQESIEKLKNNPERFHESYLCSGVTAVFDTGGFPWIFNVRDKAKNSLSAPHFFTAGPLMTFEKSIFSHPAAADLSFFVGERSEMLKGMDLLIKNKADGVNIHNIHNAENKEVLEDRLNYIIEKSKKAGIQPLVFCKSLEAGKSAIRAGAKAFIYSIEEELVDEEFLKLAKEHDIIYVPSLSVPQALEDAADVRFSQDIMSLTCVDPVTRDKILLTESYASGKGDPEEAGSNITPRKGEGSAYNRKENLRRIHAAGIKIATGSSAGAPILLHGPAIYLEMQTLAEAGLSPMEVIIAATKNGAEVIGTNDFGTVEKGKIADLLLLNKNPLENISNVQNIYLVIRGGSIHR